MVIYYSDGILTMQEEEEEDDSCVLSLYEIRQWQGEIKKMQQQEQTPNSIVNNLNLMLFFGVTT